MCPDAIQVSINCPGVPGIIVEAEWIEDAELCSKYTLKEAQQVKRYRGRAGSPHTKTHRRTPEYSKGVVLSKAVLVE